MSINLPEYILPPSSAKIFNSKIRDSLKNVGIGFLFWKRVYFFQCYWLLSGIILYEVQWSVTRRYEVVKSAGITVVYAIFIRGIFYQIIISKSNISKIPNEFIQNIFGYNIDRQKST